MPPLIVAVGLGASAVATSDGCTAGMGEGGPDPHICSAEAGRAESEPDIWAKADRGGLQEALWVERSCKPKPLKDPSP